MSESAGSDWVDVSGVEDLTNGKPYRAELEGQAVLLLKADDRFYAISNQCTHQAALLDRGVVRFAGSLATVTCPAHGSMFRLEDGRVVRGPASSPVPAYDTRVEGGRIQIRLQGS